MLVDDNSSVRGALRRTLPAYGFEICAEAENGQQALEMVNKANPDIIILDLSMPVMNGLQLAGILHENLPDVPLLLYTVHAGAPLTQRAMEAGVSAVVDKGGNFEVLVRQLQDLVDWD
jgi:DNA-binding NarL/FixJ family response regulator